MADIPLPFSCGHAAYRAGATNGHGNAKPDWADPVPVDCFWWDPSSIEPLQGPTGGDTAIADRVLVVDSAVAIDQRDRFVFTGAKFAVDALPDGERFNVDALPADYNHGPFGYSPNRLVINLKRVV